KEKPSSSKNKHYTLMERKVFLQILKKYKNVIEIKKSDATTLKDKDIAWNNICEEYNESTLISQEKNVQQLKKLWANLKQTQRDALTKEKQSRLATGGGPQEADTNVDPDILNIAPHLMKTAPVLFSSNMTETEIEEKRDLTFNIMSANESADILDSLANDDSDLKIVDSQDKHEFAFNIISSNKNVNKVDNDESDIKIGDLQDTLKTYQKQSCTTDTQRKKRKLLNLSDTEENLRMQRIKQVIDQEQHLAIAKLRHEENMAKLKENHLKQLNEVKIQHKNEINNLEIEINKTKLKILEKQYLNKENINLRL
ncbi:uncharacterized protein LOC143899110, partial [Temnothorax americanus]|uniref:uncharacterized protein LOC143899110 n=1 Tax=Temnothorax americanus TaxID=1964332 RepID=UPI0040685B94